MGQSDVNVQSPIDTARALVAGGKGLLAMDERNSACNKRFAGSGVAQTEEARRNYRELIVTTCGHACAKGLRTVKICVGSEWCRFGRKIPLALAFS